MKNKKHIVNLEYFMGMLRICLRIPTQTFDELPFEEEILAFLRYLGHGGEIKKIIGVNINKLQPWRSFSDIINKCLSGKSTGYDSLRLSQAQVLWGMYHKKNVDFAYLLWEDFVYQVKHKDAKKSNEMYYPRFTKVIINFFMTKDPSIPRRIKVNWHYVMDNQMFTIIKLVSRHQNTQQFGAMLLVKLINKDIRNSTAYKEYYDIASGAARPKTKASVRKTDEDDDDVDDQSDADEQDDDDQDSDNDGDEFVHPKQSTHDKEAKDEESFDPISSPVSSEFITSMFNPSPDAGIDSVFKSIHRVDVLVSTTVVPLLVTVPTLPLPSIPIMSQVQQAPAPLSTTAPSTFLLRDEAQAKNEDFLNKLDENIQKIIKKQVKVQVFKILPKIKKTINEQLEDRGSKRRREGKEPESTSAPKEKASKTTGKSTEGSKSHQKTTSESAPAEEPMQSTQDLEEPSHQEFETGAIDDQPVAEASQHPEWFQNQKKPLTPNRRRVIPFDHFINNNLEYLRGDASRHKNTTSVTKTKAADYGHIKWIEDLFYGFTVNRESARDVYSKRRIIAVTDLQIVEWHNYKHLDWITHLLVQEKLTNLIVEERFAFNVSLRMFTRSIVIQRRVEDLQLGVKSYQKKLNLTKPDTYRSDLKRKEAYTAYSNPRGFIYHNKDKQNSLMRIDELYKFSDGTLNDVRTTLDDRLKGIRIKYLPHGEKVTRKEQQQ
nr:hypothetical protein [Tanacetum cinerariifolium]